MRKYLVLSGMLLCSIFLSAQSSPLWMRYPSISPDGKTIAFTYKGDIYTVPVSGGKASQLTTNPAYDTQPIWSNDGSKVAFSSNRGGSFDLYVVGKDGGVPTQLTTQTGNEYPQAYKDGVIYFTASYMPDSKDIQFPSRTFAQVYKVSENGGRATIFSSLAMQNINFNKDASKLLYTDVKGYEDAWRKHHTSSIARDVWIQEITPESKFTKITSFKGEDRNAIWGSDENSIYYLSEQDGSFNIYKRDLQSKSETKLTNYKDNPVRFLSSDNNNLLCFGYDGEIYTVKEGSSPVKVNINIVSDKLEKDLVAQTITGGATAISVSPNGKEVAFIARGDVYVTSTEYSTTKQVTDTPQQERNVHFSPDGRSLVYSAERGETWGIYQSSIVRKEDKYFTYANEIKEEPLVDAGETSFQPMYSPDGKEVAYLANRTELKVINLKSKEIRTVLDGKYNYSYTDGDVSYTWSPDSKWFLADYIGIGGWNNPDIVLVKADGSGETVNLTESGYSDAGAKWTLGGKAMLWSSDRAGYRSHGSWGSHRDAYIMFFDDKEYDKFRMNKEELALFEEIEKENMSKKEKKAEEKKAEDKKKAEKDGKEVKEDVEELEFSLENRKDRVIRLTINSSSLGDMFLSAKGDKLYYVTSFEGGGDLWVRDLKANSTRLLIKGVGYGSFTPDKEGKNLYFAAGGNLKKIDIGTSAVKNIPFRAEFNYKPAREREYIFNHAWRQVEDKFYVPDIHGIDWDNYKTTYAKFLPHINNNFDFAEMLSEMLGELNGSHTGARYYASNFAPATASLGVYYDNSYSGAGLKIAEVIKNGPLTKSDSKITAGCIIEKIDGVAITNNMDFYPLLNGKVGKNVLLEVYNPDTKKRFEQKVKPISSGAESNLLYKRWVDNNRAKVEKLSGGKVGYIHVKGMDSQSFREVYSDLLGKYRNSEAVIIDTRHNGGGWLHDDLVTLLDGKEYQQFAPRGEYIGSDPFNKWLKPSCVLICEDNYSNAHGFPWVYKELGVGKLIGTSVPGTMTAVWWESQIDPSIVFGIPQVGVRDMEGNFLENVDLNPDIEVFNTPEQQLRGEDAQLKAAVDHMLKEISNGK